MQINPAEFKLLVVDDVQTNVLLLKALLGKEGYGILVANNGQEALEVIRNENPDLILLDVMMPGMDGFEVAERLKSEEFRCEIPIIFLTALDDTQSIVNGFKLGVGDFISKPFRKEELMVRIKHQLSLVAARRIIEEKNEELRKTIAGRDKMYSVIAHDLRSPMASMKMLLNTIMMSVEKDKIDPDIFDMLEMSNKTSEEVFSLLDNLLKWTKSQLGKLTVIPQKLDISGLADGVVEVMNSVAEVKHIKLIRTDHESFFVYVDIEMIKSILRNLISNAVKFSNPDSESLHFCRDNTSHPPCLAILLQSHHCLSMTILHSEPHGLYCHTLKSHTPVEDKPYGQYPLTVHKWQSNVSRYHDSILQISNSTDAAFFRLLE